MIKKRTKKRVKLRTKNPKTTMLQRHLKRLRGSATLILLLAVVIIGAFLLAGGFPSTKHVVPLEGVGEVIVDTETSPPAGANKDSLQLQDLKFKECKQQSNVSMQLDITGSMRNAIDDLKTAVFGFTDSMTDDSIIGIQAYDSTNPRREVIPISLYKDVKDQIHPAVNALQIGDRTPSFEAISYSKELLQAGQAKFPGKQFSYIFFSDGDPNEGPHTVADMAQASQGIKDLGVTVYAIGLGNIKREVLNAIATSPDKVFYAPTPEDLPVIYKQLSQKLCQ